MSYLKRWRRWSAEVQALAASTDSDNETDSSEQESADTTSGSATSAPGEDASSPTEPESPDLTETNSASIDFVLSESSTKAESSVSSNDETDTEEP
ncbi:hypothetical protein DPMN_106799 [Dreissena polymorpha]|uniref:Uncharacterized protein n=1 Tax=Dreissena polymorpha TaxID=45954 RepID=A0A9D4QJ02_DREPO|nr:hypothetical protein DPMN_106799 [Dreissena polymorpha]